MRRFQEIVDAPGLLVFPHDVRNCDGPVDFEPGAPESIGQLNRGRGNRLNRVAGCRRATGGGRRVADGSCGLDTNAPIATMSSAVRFTTAPRAARRETMTSRTADEPAMRTRIGLAAGLEHARSVAE